MVTQYVRGPRFAAVDVVHELETHERFPDPEGMMGGQAVTYPAMGDYDTSQNLILDHNRKMPYHTGETEHEAEVGVTLREMGSEGPQEPPMPRGEQWEHAYGQTAPSDNYEGGGSAIRMGGAAPNMDPTQEELREMIASMGAAARMAPIPGTPFGYLADSDVSGMTIMVDSRDGRLFVGVPSDYTRSGQRQPWLCVDLDGTILEHPPKNPAEYGSTDVQLPFGEPQQGAAEALAELASLGWRISIYTARFGDENLDDDTIQRWSDEIADHLERHQIPYSDVWVGRKPRADYFVDDKAITFNGDWADILQQLTLISSPPRAPEEDGTVEVEEHEAASDPVFGAGESENDWVDISWGQRHPPAVWRDDLSEIEHGG